MNPMWLTSEGEQGDHGWTGDWFICVYCKKNFPSKNECSSHRRREHPEKIREKLRVKSPLRNQNEILGQSQTQSSSQDESKGHSQNESQGQSQNDSKGQKQNDSKGQNQHEIEGQSQNEIKSQSQNENKAQRQDESKGQSQNESKIPSQNESQGQSQAVSQGENQNEIKGQRQNEIKGQHQNEIKVQHQNEIQGQNHNEIKGQNRNEGKGQAQNEIKGQRQDKSKGQSQYKSEGQSQNDNKGQNQDDSKGQSQHQKNRKKKKKRNPEVKQTYRGLELRVKLRKSVGAIDKGQRISRPRRCKEEGVRGSYVMTWESISEGSVTENAAKREEPGQQDQNVQTDSALPRMKENKQGSSSTISTENPAENSLRKTESCLGPNLPPWTCNECGTDFQSEGHLSYHLLDHANKRQRLLKRPRIKSPKKEGKKIERFGRQEPESRAKAHVEPADGSAGKIPGSKVRSADVSSGEESTEWESVKESFNQCQRSFSSLSPRKHRVKLRKKRRGHQKETVVTGSPGASTRESSTQCSNIGKAQDLGGKAVALEPRSVSERMEEENPGPSPSTPPGHLQVKEVKNLGEDRDREIMYKCTVCTECGLQFSSEGHRKYHLLVHTAFSDDSGNRPFKCLEIGCGATYRLKAKLQKHMLTHTGQKPQGSTLASSLRQHMLIHTREGPFACRYCDRRFADMDTLNDHTNLHTGEKPWICCVCEKPFVCMSTLDLHMRTHMDTRPHACTLCGLLFSDVHQLRHHSLIHAEERPSSCNEDDSNSTADKNEDRTNFVGTSVIKKSNDPSHRVHNKYPQILPKLPVPEPPEQNKSPGGENTSHNLLQRPTIPPREPNPNPTDQRNNIHQNTTNNYTNFNVASLLNPEQNKGNFTIGSMLRQPGEQLNGNYNYSGSGVSHLFNPLEQNNGDNKDNNPHLIVGSNQMPMQIQPTEPPCAVIYLVPYPTWH